MQTAGTPPPAHPRHPERPDLDSRRCAWAQP